MLHNIFRRRGPAICVFLLATAACSRGGTLGGPVAIISSEEMGGAPTAFELAHATFSGIMDEPVTLIGGRWEGEPFVQGGASRPMVGLVDHFVLTGDLDGDGLEEAVALLWESSGGSGTRLFLAAMARGDDSITNLSTTLIGDRVQIRSGAIANGEIALDLIRAGPEDAACCPTGKAQVTWTLGESGLTKIADEANGELSLADLADRGWILVEHPLEQPQPAGVEISLLFQDDRVSGKSGCNSYFAGVVTGGPGELGFNGMGATRMACPEPVMQFERRYLQVLAGARNYRFLAGYLAINCETEDGLTVLLFSPRELFEGVSADTD